MIFKSAHRTFFPSLRAAILATAAVISMAAYAQESANPATSPAPVAAPQDGQVVDTNPALVPAKKEKLTREEKKEAKVVPSKDTVKQLRKDKKTAKVDPLAGKDANLPDRQLYDKALIAAKRGHYDVARLDLQTLLNTYPDTQYQMRAKLAIADSWYKEGGTAALTQAESEYKDFITFFPNAPEAAEAQMRVGDIYFRQMDKPDRDYSKSKHAEEEYRLMLQQFPESTLVPAAQQRLREVQEVMATRETDIAAFYATHANWPATIARYQTVVDTYPLYSHMDDALIGLGDAFSSEARYVRSLKLPEGPKARLEKIYDDQAIAAYKKVVLEHAAAAHVEDAKDRLAAMNLPIPTPSADQMAASVALENSRGQYKLANRVGLIIFRKPDVVLASTKGVPSLSDPKPTLAPTVSRQVVADFTAALNPSAVAPAKPVAAVIDTDAPPTTTTAAPTTAAAAPLQFQDVPAADPGTGTTGAVITNVTGASSSRAGATGVGVEIVQPGSTTGTPGNGLSAVGPTNTTPLPAVEKAGAAPDAINDVNPATQPATQLKTTKKNPKPEFDKSDESSSKHKKKKGLAKVNPF